MEENIVPEQEKGRSTGALEEIGLSSASEAIALFKSAKMRLLDINRWKQYAGPGSADFVLTNRNGQPVYRLPEIGDLIRIDLPGPGTDKGNGYDWVRLEAFDEQYKAEESLCAFRVRPCPNPENEDAETAHFYKDTATSSFILKRVGKKLIAAEEGRNEIENMESQGIFDKIRNFLFAKGASHGMSYPQWKMLVKGILKP